MPQSQTINNIVTMKLLAIFISVVMLTAPALAEDKKKECISGHKCNDHKDAVMVCEKNKWIVQQDCKSSCVTKPFQQCVGEPIRNPY
jgi:hypothetical protein